MPTEITRLSAPATRHYRERRIDPLTIAAIALFVLLHLVSGVMLERSHARAGLEVPSLAALDDEATTCASAVKPETPALPYD